MQRYYHGKTAYPPTLGCIVVQALVFGEKKKADVYIAGGIKNSIFK